MQIEVSQIPHRFRNRFLRGNNGGNVIYNSGGSTATTNTNTFTPVYLWGQYFDDSEDVNGSMEVQGDITATGTISTPTVDTSTLTATNGTIQTLDSSTINTSTLTATNGTIQTLDSSTINTHNLTVTGSAHFFELIIDKLKSVGGTVILSAANAKIDKVVSVSGGYKLYWRKEDSERAKAISNDFAVNDQVICMSFNAQTGVSHNISNKYYWRLVTAVGDESTEIDGETVAANYIVVSDSVKDGQSVPEVADEIMQLGYRGSDDAERQSAIILSAYKSPDTTIQSPAIVQYSGINDFNLSSHRYTYLAHNGNVLRGNLRVENGTSVEDLITEFSVDEDAIIAHINSSLGTTGIDILNQKITLTAENTNIVGNLNLYDSQNNGLTVYDDSSTARVNIQSDAIDSIADLAMNDTYNHFTLSQSGSVPTWDMTTATETINWSVQTTVDFDNFSINFSVGDYYPSAYNMNVQLIVTSPSGDTKKYSFIAYRQDSFGHYMNADEKIRYTVVNGGLHTFKVRCYISNSYVSGTGYLNVNIRVQSGSLVQTCIGRDGFYSHAGSNKLVWVSESELQLRHGYNGIRWNNAGKFRNESMQVCAQIKGSAPNFKPVWIPFYNYTPLYNVGVGSSQYLFTSQTVVNINEVKYAFQIDPLRDCGICYVAGQAMDGDGNYQESWVILPPESFPDEEGDTVTLPVGWTVTIINGSRGDLFVAPHSNGNQVIIVDSNRNDNLFCELNDTMTSDTYIYIGSYADGRHWRAMHDTQ